MRNDSFVVRATLYCRHKGVDNIWIQPLDGLRDIKLLSKPSWFKSYLVVKKFARKLLRYSIQFDSDAVTELPLHDLQNARGLSSGFKVNWPTGAPHRGILTGRAVPLCFTIPGNGPTRPILGFGTIKRSDGSDTSGLPWSAGAAEM